MRRVGSYLPGLTAKRLKSRIDPPGHPRRPMRRTESDYSKRLREKQKLRFNYGVRERQLRRLYKTASRMCGNVGSNLLILLESRLDNVVFRAGFAPTIPAARQLVAHGHVYVDDQRVNVASFRTRPGNKLHLSQTALEMQLVQDSLALNDPRPAFLDFDATKSTVDVIARPSEGDILLELDVSLVVEFYNR